MLNRILLILPQILSVIVGVALGFLVGRGCSPECPQPVAVKIRPAIITAKADTSLAVTPKPPIKIIAQGRRRRIAKEVAAPVVLDSGAAISHTETGFTATLDTTINGANIRVEYAELSNKFTVEVQCPPDTSRVIERVITVTQPVEITTKEPATLTEKTLWAGVGAGILAIITMIFGE